MKSMAVNRMGFPFMKNSLPQNEFEAIAEAVAEEILVEIFVEHGLADFSHAIERVGILGAKFFDCGDGGVNVAVADVEAEGMAVEKIGDVGFAGAEIEDWPADRHRAVNFAGVNDARPYFRRARRCAHQRRKAKNARSLSG